MTMTTFLAAALAVAWTNDLAVMTLDGKGSVVSLTERATGRELLARPAPFLFAESSVTGLPTRLETRGDDRWAWKLSSPAGAEVVLKVSSFGPGWTFEVVAADLPGVRNLFLGRLNAACRLYNGEIASMASDEASGVCVRSYDASGVMSVKDGALSVRVPAARGFVGRRVGVVAGRRADLKAALRRMTEVAGVFHSVNGGAWSLGAEGNRGSYVFADLVAASTDDWVDLAERAGCETVHLHAWWKTRGHYGFCDRFPRGATDWTNVCARIHGAGLKVGMHTLTGGIEPADDWMSGPHCETNYIDWCAYTLARPFAPTDAELVVEEVPAAYHHTFHNYGSHGNTLRLGDAAFRYTGVRRERPYGFTGVTPVATGRTDLATFPVGTKVHYLYQRYDAFYPDPDSPLVDKVGAAIGAARDLGRVDQIYLDGGEALTWSFYRQADDLIREKIVRHLKPSMLIEGSNGDAFTWWYLSRYGAWDHPRWGVKRMHDAHLEDVPYARMANLIEPQLGWWKPCSGDATARGHFLDEMEYFASKNAGLDAAMALDLDGESTLSCGRPLTYEVTRQITLLGWYERFRMARAFSDEALARMRAPQAETRLRQDENSGIWTLSSVTCQVQRVAGETAWTVGAVKGASAAIRIEALYGAATPEKAQTLLSAADLPALSKTVPTNGLVSLDLAAGTSAEHGPTLCLTARNGQATARGACVFAERWWREQPFFSMKGAEGFGVWVKGDGSGALLAFEFATPHLYHLGRSPHYVRLDFTGWRHFDFLFREREAYEAYAHEWPSRIHPMIVCRTPLNVEHIDNIRLLLNELKPGTTKVELSALTAIRAGNRTEERPHLTLNGRSVSVPFALTSGEYAELEDGVWRKFSEDGQLLARAAGPVVALKAGANALAWSGALRADVTVQAFTDPIPALTPRTTWSAEQRRRLGYEAVPPAVHAPHRGVSEPLSVPVRPGEVARLELVIWGPAVRPSLSANGRVWTFPAVIGREEKLHCRDGRRWRVLNSRFETVAAGVLDEPLPLLTESTVFALASGDERTADLRVDAAKRTLAERPSGTFLAAPFGDGMVLQRERAVPVWGKAKPGAEVAVSFAGETVRTTAGTNGAWRVALPPMAASKQARTLTVSADGEIEAVRDVLVGEVWLCSGQSNMEMAMGLIQPRYGDGIGRMVAQVTHKPFIRHLKAPHREGGWHALTPDHLMSGWRSALGVHYALELYAQLDVPIGIVEAAIGGSNIDSWIPGNRRQDNWYGCLVAPFAPYAIRGVLWYQGETNIKEVDGYSEKLQQLHDGWRKAFDNPRLRLYYVQLAPGSGSPYPDFAAAQVRHAEEDPDAAVTIIADIGNIHDIHPNNKWLVAKRLALHALKRDYGFPDVEDDSPVPVDACVCASNRVRIAYAHAKQLYVYTEVMQRDAAFELAGADGVWKKAEIVNFPRVKWPQYGTIGTNVVELVAPGVAAPMQVRHLWKSPWKGCLYNEANLPAGPFRAALPYRR